MIYLLALTLIAVWCLGWLVWEIRRKKEPPKPFTPWTVKPKRRKYRDHSRDFTDRTL